MIQRLNKNEYQYTMEDLVGLRMNYTLGLSDDPLPDGFLNNGKSLGSASQIEHYLKTACKALVCFWWCGEEPDTKVSEVKWNKGKYPRSKQQIAHSKSRTDQGGQLLAWKFPKSSAGSSESSPQGICCR